MCRDPKNMQLLQLYCQLSSSHAGSTDAPHSQGAHMCGTAKHQIPSRCPPDPAESLVHPGWPLNQASRRSWHRQSFELSKDQKAQGPLWRMRQYELLGLWFTALSLPQVQVEKPELIPTPDSFSFLSSLYILLVVEFQFWNFFLSFFFTLSSRFTTVRGFVLFCFSNLVLFFSLQLSAMVQT